MKESPPEADGAARRNKLIAGYGGALVLVALIALGTGTGVIPLFYAQGTGPTNLRQTVLIAALILFSITSTSMMTRFIQQKARFLYWYSMALALLALTMGGAFLQYALGTLMGWLARIPLYVSGIYFFMAILSASREARTQNVPLNQSLSELFLKAERKLSFVHGSITDGHYELDRDWRFVRINNRALAYFGRKREDVIGRLHQDVFPTIKGSIIEEQYRKVFSHADDVHFESQSVVLPDKWVETHAYPTEEGGIAVFFRDITERKEAERQLQESDAMLAHAQQLAHVGHWVRDLATGNVRWSDEMYRIFGLEPQVCAVDGPFFLQHVHADDRARVEKDLRDAKEGVKPYNEIFRIVRPDGSIRWVQSRAEVTRTPDGKPIRVFGAILDITERKYMEEELRTSHDELELRVNQRTAELNSAYEVLQMEVEGRKKVEKELRSLTTAIEQAVEGVFVLGPDGTIVYANKAFSRMLGYPEEELIGQYIWATRANDLHERSARIQATINSGNIWTGRITRKRKDGALIETETSVGPIRDDDGRIINQVGVSRDITDQLRLEDQLRQAQKMEAIGTLAGGIAHDFNNILAAMIGFSELAADEIPAGSDAQRYLKRIVDAGLRGRELVRQILAFSRKAEGERVEIRLTSLVKETYLLLRPSLPSTIKMNLATTTGDDYVAADPTQVQQVLMNLATNAADAMRNHGGELTIEASSVIFPPGSPLPDPDMEPGTYVKLTVKDTGSGMTEDVRQKIFEPFFTTKEKGKGTGMGLAVVYGVVKNHGGAVTVQSEPGKGSTFEVFLPQVQRPEARKKETSISLLPTGTERILFVDDEELLVEMTRRMLESLGYQVVTAKHGTEAWNLFLEDPSRFDLVITDQTMPDVTGMTLAQKMLGVRKEMPVVLCTGYSEMVSAEKATEVGISAFVMKPLLRKELAETIRRVLDGSKAPA